MAKYADYLRKVHAMAEEELVGAVSRCCASFTHKPGSDRELSTYTLNERIRNTRAVTIHRLK